MADTHKLYVPTEVNDAVTLDVIAGAQSEPRAVSPDVRVWRTDPRVLMPDATAVIDPSPIQSTVPLEVPVRLARVEVREAGTATLVTAIEILPPINKRPGRERQKYLRKRRELLPIPFASPSEPKPEEIPVRISKAY